jgi:hypothetical protein
MAALEKIDRLKTDLQGAKQALHEADNWTILATQFEEVTLTIKPKKSSRYFYF